MEQAVSGTSWKGKVFKGLLGIAVLGLLGLVAPGKASASTITYDISGTLSDGVSFASGSWVDINTSTGLATDSSITLTGVGSVSGAPNGANTPTEYLWCEISCSFDGLELQGSFSSLGTSGTATADFYVVSSADGYGTVTLTDAPASTPEPPTMLLLGVGLMGLLGGALLLRRPQMDLQVKQELA